MKNELDVINEQMAKMQEAFTAIQQPRTDFELENFVVKAHDTEPRQWAQCVLELQNKYDAIRRAILEREKKEIEIRELLTGDEKSRIDAKLKQIDVEQLDRAMVGALREFKALYCIYQSYPKQYTRDELNADQVEYWQKRLKRQALLDEQATGRITQGNLDSLRLAGVSVAPQMNHVDTVERRFLETSCANQKILVAMATEKKLKKLPEQFKIHTPSGWQVKLYNCHGRSIDEAYKDIFWTAIKDGAKLLLTIEDDTFPPEDALVKLMEHWKEGKEVISGWYPKRTKVREGTPIVFDGKERTHLVDDGKLHEVWVTPFGCTLFDVSIFSRIPEPWAITTGILTQDSFFSQKAREAGIKLWCDTSIKCKHVDRKTKEVFL